MLGGSILTSDLLLHLDFMIFRGFTPLGNLAL